MLTVVVSRRLGLHVTIKLFGHLVVRPLHSSRDVLNSGIHIILYGLHRIFGELLDSSRDDARIERRGKIGVRFIERS